MSDIDAVPSFAVIICSSSHILSVPLEGYVSCIHADCSGLPVRILRINKAYPILVIPASEPLFNSADNRFSHLFP